MTARCCGEWGLGFSQSRSPIRVLRTHPPDPTQSLSRRRQECKASIEGADVVRPIDVTQTRSADSHTENQQAWPDTTLWARLFSSRLLMRKWVRRRFEERHLS